jgi:hypothetical protein
MKLYTIGHSNHMQEKLVQLLVENGIQTLVDVRTSPYSRHNPQFNKDTLEFWLSGPHSYPFQVFWEAPGDPSYKKGWCPRMMWISARGLPAVMDAGLWNAIEQLIEIAQTPAVSCAARRIR